MSFFSLISFDDDDDDAFSSYIYVMRVMPCKVCQGHLKAGVRDAKCMSMML